MKRDAMWVLVIVVVVAVGMGLVQPWWGQKTEREALTACKSNLKSNLKNIEVAIEMYSAGGAGRFPPRLECLRPCCLKVIPTCPSARTDTYGQGYSTASNPDIYTVVCGRPEHVQQGCKIGTQGLIVQ